MRVECEDTLGGGTVRSVVYDRVIERAVVQHTSQIGKLFNTHACNVCVINVIILNVTRHSTNLTDL